MVFPFGMKTDRVINESTQDENRSHRSKNRFFYKLKPILITVLFILMITGCKSAPDIPELPCFILYWFVAGDYQELCLCTEQMRQGDIADVTDCTDDIEPDRQADLLVFSGDKIETRIYGEATSLLLAAGIDGDLLDCLYRDPLISIPPEPGLCWQDTSTLIQPPADPVTMITRCSIEETGLELSTIFGHTFSGVMRIHVEDDQDQIAADYYFAPGIGIVEFTRLYVEYDFETGGELESWEILENRDCDCYELAENFFPEGNDNRWTWRLHGEQDEMYQTYAILGKVCAGETASGQGDDYDTDPLLLQQPERILQEKKFATMLRIQFDSSGEGSISIHAPNGHLVRSLYSGSVRNGLHRFIWNGKDDSGTPVASGRYLIRVENNGTSRTTGFTCLR